MSEFDADEFLRVTDLFKKAISVAKSIKDNDTRPWMYQDLFTQAELLADAILALQSYKLPPLMQELMNHAIVKQTELAA